MRERPVIHPSVRLRSAALLLGAGLDRARSDPGAVGLLLVARTSGPLGQALWAAAALGARLGSSSMQALTAGRAGPESLDQVVPRLRRLRRPAARRRAARVLLAVDRSQDAAELVATDQTLAARRLLARAEHARGRWDLAIAGLPAGDRLRRRLESERSLLTRRPPAVRGPRTRRPGGSPTVLHLLTNSRPHTSSGYTSRSHQVLQSQIEAGVSVAAVTPLGYPATVLRMAHRSPELVGEVAYHRLLPARWGADVLRRHDVQLELLDRLVEQVRPDVLHAHSHFVNGLIALEVGARHGLPVVYEVRGMLEETWAFREGDDARATDRYRVFREQEEHVVRSADAVLTIGDAMRQDLAQRTGRQDIRLVPNAVSAAEFVDDVQRASARARARGRLGIGPDDLVVGSVSSLVDYEGFDLLLEAASALATGGTPVTVLLVGDGAAAPGLRRAARASAAGATVLMPGRVARDQVPDHLAALDVFVVPRRDAPVCRLVTPLKPAEAMAAGLPLVVSDLPALREFVTDGVEGLVFPADDTQGLVSALMRLRSPSVRAVMGAAARESARASRTWEANAATYLDVYRRILDGDARGGDSR